MSGYKILNHGVFQGNLMGSSIWTCKNGNSIAAYNEEDAKGEIF